MVPANFKMILTVSTALFRYQKKAYTKMYNGNTTMWLPGNREGSFSGIFWDLISKMIFWKKVLSLILVAKAAQVK